MSSVTIYAVGKAAQTVTLEQIGDDELSGGRGGWEVLNRPTREAMTAWRSTPGVTWTLPVSFDGFGDIRDRIVEQDIALVESWGLPDSKLGRPPELVIDAAVGLGSAAARWVLEDITYGAQIRNRAGQRIRQDVSLTFLKYVPGKILKGPAAKSRGKGGKGGKGGKS